MTRVVNKWKDFVDELLTFKWILFGVVIYIYGLRAKEHMYVASLQTKLLLNKWDLLHKFLVIFTLFCILSCRSFYTVLFQL